MEYLIGIRGVQSGPISEAEIREKIAANAYPAGTLCWTEGWPQWRLLVSVFGPGAVASAQAPTEATPDLRRIYNDGSSNDTVPEMSGLALASLILGLASLVIFFPLIPAIICGHLACSQIKKSGGRKTGRGAAITGLVISYFMLTTVPSTVYLVVIPAVQNFRAAVEENVIHQNLIQIYNGAQNFMTDNDAVDATYADLIGSGRSRASYIEPIIPLSGEDYTKLVIKKSDRRITMTLGDGRVVLYER